MKLITILLVLTISAMAALAQQPTPPPPPPTPAPTPNYDAQRQINLEQQRRIAQFERLKNVGPGEKKIDSRTQASYVEITKIYRKSTGKELAMLAPDANLLRIYKDFLHQPGTGITRLVADFGCGNDNAVIMVSDECLKYSMPGGGSSYSFRKGDYRIRRLADLTFSKNRFETSGLISHGILVNLGKADLRTINLDSAGLAFVVGFTPVTEFNAAQEIEGKLLRGIESSGFKYSSSSEVVENATFVLRSVAYNGDLYRSLNGILYDEFDFDKRLDVIVAFRVVETRPGESVTILWKELARKKVPKLKWPDGADARPAK